MSNVQSIHSATYLIDGRIDCIVKFDTLDFEVPFTADPNDIEKHGRDIHAALVAGHYGPIAGYAPPPVIEQVGPNVIT